MIQGFTRGATIRTGRKAKVSYCTQTRRVMRESFIMVFGTVRVDIPGPTEKSTMVNGSKTKNMVADSGKVSKVINTSVNGIKA